MSYPGSAGDLPTREAGLPPYLGQDFFVYPIAIGSLATTVSAVINQQVQADSDFEWIASSCSGNKNGAAEPWPDTNELPINVQIQDSGVGRNLFLNATPLTSIAGVGKLAFYLPVTHFFKSKANITINAQNIGGSTYDNIVWNLIGRKLYLPAGG